MESVLNYNSEDPLTNVGGFLINLEDKIIAKKIKVKCPYCGHDQKIQYVTDAICRGVFFKSQARHCKREFEIKINQDK